MARQRAKRIERRLNICQASDQSRQMFAEVDQPRGEERIGLKPSGVLHGGEPPVTARSTRPRSDEYMLATTIALNSLTVSKLVPAIASLVNVPVMCCKL